MQDTKAHFPKSWRHSIAEPEGYDVPGRMPDDPNSNYIYENMTVLYVDVVLV